MKYRKIKANQFPRDFNWGVSISAYQNEGKWNGNGKGASIWDTFTHNTNFKNGNGDTATNFYDCYIDDIKRVKDLNLDCFRFSISWPRIFPNGIGKINQEGVQFYHDVIDTCIKLDIQHWVTLYHWDLPQVLEDKGGWTNREILNWFEKYADFCSKEFGDKVKNWIVLNEPMSFVGLGYFMNMHAPGKKGLKNFMSAAHHATLCQSIGGRTIRRNVKDSYIGTTFSCSHVKPVNRLRKNKKAADRIDALLNRFFIEPALGLGYPTDSIPGLNKIEQYFEPNDRELMKFDFDFIGIQYYFKIVAKFSLFPPILFAKEIPAIKRNVKTNNMGMEIYPKGILKMLDKYNSYSNVGDIYITESGVCFDDALKKGKVKDKNRIKYFEKTFYYTLKAIKKNTKVKGFFIWTLVDNFEWAEGIKARFGLYYTDFTTQKRIIKKSGLWIQKFLGDK